MNIATNTGFKGVAAVVAPSTKGPFLFIYFLFYFILFLFNRLNENNLNSTVEKREVDS